MIGIFFEDFDGVGLNCFVCPELDDSFGKKGFLDVVYKLFGHMPAGIITKAGISFVDDII